MTFATVGVGSIPQLLGVLLQLRADMKLIEVPYKGGAPAALDLIGGRVDLAFLNVPRCYRRYGVANCARSPSPARRAPGAAETPTMAEAGYRDAMGTWYGLRRQPRPRARSSASSMPPSPAR